VRKSHRRSQQPKLEVGSGREISNRREPGSCLGRVFNSKLGRTWRVPQGNGRGSAINIALDGSTSPG
jgi:hypothetical protein